MLTMLVSLNKKLANNLPRLFELTKVTQHRPLTAAHIKAPQISLFRELENCRQNTFKSSGKELD